MGIPVMVLGESGTGKSASLRNFGADEISIINVDGKVLPFKNRFSKIVNTDSAERILNLLRSSKSKAIVIDDAQYIMANEFMRRGKEKGYEKFTDMGLNVFNIINCVKDLAPDTVVYFLWHTETLDGTLKAKTVGRMLDEKITLEGKFTIVLRTQVTDGRYTFRTQNNGFDTVKTPMGMFGCVEIENDLKAVDAAIREYYEFPALETAGRDQAGG